MTERSLCLNCRLVIDGIPDTSAWYAHPDEIEEYGHWHGCCPGSPEHVDVCSTLTAHHERHCDLAWTEHRPASEWRTLEELILYRRTQPRGVSA